MSFRKPITTLKGLIWWKVIKQDTYFIMQEHRVGLPLWPYKYRILMRANSMEIANSNDVEEIRIDWEYLKSHAVPQIDKMIDAGKFVTDINWAEVFNKVIKSIPQWKNGK